MQIMTPEIRGGSRALPEHMRAPVLLFAAVAFGGMCAVAPPPVSKTTGGDVQVRTISAGGNAANTPEPVTPVPAFDDATYRKNWSAFIGQGEAPNVDFTKEAVVFLFAGMRNTGGYSIEVRGAKLDGETLVVDAAVQGPPPGASSRRSSPTRTLSWP